MIPKSGLIADLDRVTAIDGDGLTVEVLAADSE